MIKYLSFCWNFELQFKIYLKSVANFIEKPSKKVIKHKLVILTLITFLLLQFFHFSFLFFRPLSKMVRFIHFDVSVIWNSSTIADLLVAAVCLHLVTILFLLFWYFIYTPSQYSFSQTHYFDPLLLIYRIFVIGQDTDFLFKRLPSQQILVLTHLKRLKLKWFSPMFYCLTAFVAALNLYFDINKWLTLFYSFSFEWQFFFTQTTGFFCFLTLQLNELGLLLVLNVANALNILMCHLLFTLANTIFLQFKQANQLLTAKIPLAIKVNDKFDQRKNRHILSDFTLNKFVHYHSQTVLHILASSVLFGGFVLGFIVTQFPLNTYLVLCIVTRRFNTLTTIIMSIITFFQLVTILGYHAIMAQISNNAKSFVGPLYKWSATEAVRKAKKTTNNKGKKEILVRHRVVLADSKERKQTTSKTYHIKKQTNNRINKTHLKVANYLDKFDKNTTYCISYGFISLGAISYSSYGKFLCLYFELVLYWLSNHYII